MSSKMLIDASHPEETRVVVLKGQRVEEFDFESADKRQLRGNIYLAKVTRVEPSLQAAFVDYGGNRHGFLAFSEIHPDYYQIPHADRQALLEEEARAHRDEDDESRSNGHRRSRRHKRDNAVTAMDRRDAADPAVSEPALIPEGSEADSSGSWSEGPVSFDGETDEVAEAGRDFASDAPEAAGASGERGISPEGSGAPSAAEPNEISRDEHAAADSETAPGEAVSDVSPDESEGVREAVGHQEPATHAPDTGTAPSFDPSNDPEVPASEAMAAMIEGGSDSIVSPEPSGRTGADAEHEEGGPEESEEESVEQIGGDEIEEAVRRAPRSRRHYKIQEVIKRRQILLVQVVKEERGNKGAALTTYLSLAGRYSVLMPNTARGGGISRKITDPEDRKRLKAIAQDLEVPEGMGIILRTAGAARSNVEVNRDFEYLLRMWESVRELTLKSTAPSLVYEEGSLIKRSIRDLYTRDVEEVLVAGEEGYREARDFMRMLMPSAARNVQLYRDPQPIFAKTGAEAQLDAMFSNHVTLKSGGYLVINQTEALVAIDVNSGRSTREHNIEDTALRTNLEAADEVARQLRLRDLAGLIVVDFIDMEEGRNNRAVERRIKEALKNDRARIQIGRISHFGLLEMSRQRIRTGVLEGSTVICPHCAGSGTIRSTASIALHVLRLLEDALIKDASHNLIVRTRTEVALYILNQKRSTLNDLETRFGVSLTVAADQALTGMIYHAIDRGEPAALTRPVPLRGESVRVDSIAPVYDEASSRLGGEDDEEDADGVEDIEAEGEAGTADRDLAQSNGDGRRRKRRRRRRGREREPQAEAFAHAMQPGDEEQAAAGADDDIALSEPAPAEAAPEGDFAAEAELPLVDAGAPAGYSEDEIASPEPQRKRRSRRGASRPDEDGAAPEGRVAEGDAQLAAGSTEDVTGDDLGPVPKRRRSPRSRAVPAVAPEAEAVSEANQAVTTPAEPAGAAELPPNTEAASPEQSDDSIASGRNGSDATVESSQTGNASATPPTAAPDPDRPKRSGWWQRAKATFGS